MGRIDIDGHLGGNRRRGSPSNRSKRRKHRVVIHTSPFQRCVQTSIAISAGIAQRQAPAYPSPHQYYSKPHVMHSGSPHIRAMDGRKSPYLSAITEPEDQGRPKRTRGSHRPLLRVDAFLGEWLSPEYFDNITHPPESKMMLASSKAYLLHHEDPINLTYTSDRMSIEQGNFPGGWGSGSASSSKAIHSDDDTPLTDMSNPSQTAPRLERAASHSLGSSPKRSDMALSRRAERSPTAQSTAYVPPVPSYAISPSQPIPSGYVSHARDACIKIDTLWDSLRPPLEWGSGGEYGEEWSALHKRMRKGLNEMITWYRSHDNSETLNPIKEDLPESQNSGGEDQEDYDDETDTVLVLVTHGAGCNALIGALTSQPVLLDVGMASLTMAVRKTVGYKRVSSPHNEDVPASPNRRRYSQMDFGISEDYEVKLTASMDHVRTGSPFLAGPPPQRTPSLPVREKSPYRYERPGFLNSHHHKASPTKEYFPVVDPPAEESLGALRKSATAVVRSPPGGLWSMPVSKPSDDATERESRYPSLQTGHLDPVQARNLGSSGASERVEIDRRERLNGSSNSGRTSPSGILPDPANRDHSIVPNGLWGAPPQALGTERDKGAKRRWTLSQAS